MSTPSETRVAISKLDAKKQIAYGAVYIPYVPDSQGDYMTPEEIERVAHNFLKKGSVNAIDTEHNLQRNGSAVVESFLSRDGDPDFPVAGSWVLGVHIPDKDHWAKTERGEIGGFSMYGTGRRVQRLVEIEVPDDGVLFGKTETSASMGTHGHLYALDFDEKGGFLGGETDEANGHSHRILKGTVTEPGPDGHRHRFSFMDTLAKGCGPTTDHQKKWQEKRRRMRKADWDESKVNRGKTTAESNDGSFAPKGTTTISNDLPSGGGGGRPKFGEPGSTKIAGTPFFGERHVDSWPTGITGLVITATDSERKGNKYSLTHEGTGKALGFAPSRGALWDRAQDLKTAFPEVSWSGDEASLRTAIGSRGKEVANIMRGLSADTPSDARNADTGARRGRGDYVSLQGREPLARYATFEAGKAYVFESAFGHGEQTFFRPETQLKNGNWKGTVLDEGAGGRTRGKTKSGIFEPPRFGSPMKWYRLNDDEVPSRLRKDDVSEEDMPEPVAEQKEATCKECRTSKACKKAGRCLIQYEAAEDEEDEEDEEEEE